MSGKRSLIVLCVLACIAPTRGRAQACYTAPTEGKCPISGGSCSKNVELVSTTDDGYNYKFGPTNCCGENVMLPVEQLGTCQQAELMTPDEAKHLLASAEQAPILIAGCDGYLRPLRSLGSNEGDGSNGSNPTLAWIPRIPADLRW
jgi:hypothetical protein